MATVPQWQQDRRSNHRQFSTMFAEVEPSPWRKDTQTSMTALAGSTVQLFNFKGAEVRLVQVDGNPWFVAKEVCAVLGLNFHNGSCSHHLTKLGADEKQTISRSEVEVGCYGRLSIVSESGLYKLALRSDKPEAKAFQDWVTKDVLPAIRKVWLSLFCYREVFQRNTSDAV